MSEPVLQVENLSKSFRIPHEKHQSLKHTVLNFRRQSYDQLDILQNINLEVKKGEFFGIVGRNGSGKSTLLKTIAGIYHPDQGGVIIDGRLTPFIELGVGFNNELSGQDNVFLNGAILGLSRKEIEEKYDEIVAFAELEQFMEQKLKNYSSGMQVRLAFSIAIQAHKDILLIDEVLAVGDAAFQRKCFNLFKQIKKEGKTVVFVSHDMEAVQEYCDTALLINDGKVAYRGKPSEVSAAYNQANFSQEAVSEEQPADEEKSKHFGTKEMTIKDVHTQNASGEKSNYFKPKEKIIIHLEVEANEDVKSPLIGLQLENNDGTVVFATNTEIHDIQTDAQKGEVLNIECSFDNYYGNGTYYISAAAKDETRAQLYDLVGKVHQIEIAGWKGAKSLTYLENKLTVSKVGT